MNLFLAVLCVSLSARSAFLTVSGRHPAFQSLAGTKEYEHLADPVFSPGQ